MRTLGPKDALGAAVFFLGLFLILAPLAANKVATEVASDTLSILIGMTIVTGVLVLIAGIAVLFGIKEVQE
jgi:hypothetical protein